MASVSIGVAGCLLTMSYVIDDEAHTHLNQIVGLKAQKATCRIDVRGSNSGSGFHWGNGWILTNSHVVLGLTSRNDEIDYDNVDMKRLTFTFPEGAVFEANDRVALVVPVGKTNHGIPDLALIKLGHQTNYARSHFSKWEESEARQLDNIPQLASQVRHISQNDQVYVTHYGCQGLRNVGSDNPPPPLPLQQSRGFIREVNEHTFWHSSFTSPGSSGSPVLSEADHTVVGVSLSGNATDSCAVRLDSTAFVSSYFNYAIGQMETYLAYTHVSETEPQYANQAAPIAACALHQLISLETAPEVQVHLFLPLGGIPFQPTSKA